MSYCKGNFYSWQWVKPVLPEYVFTSLYRSVIIHEQVCRTNGTRVQRRSRGHNQEAWFTDEFWNLNQKRSGKHVSEQTHAIKTDSRGYLMSSKTHLHILLSPRQSHTSHTFTLDQEKLRRSEEFLSTPGSYRWHIAVSFGEMDEETNTGFHQWLCNALRELSEQDKGY